MTYKEPLTTTTQPGLITLAGDLGGAATSPTVVSITGASGVVNVAATGNIITWAAATTAPGIAQATQTSDAACADITIAPQLPFASASSHKSGGNLVIALPAPVSGGAESSFKVTSFGGTLLTVNTGGVGSNTYCQLSMSSSNSISAFPSTLAITGGSGVQLNGNGGEIGIANSGIQLGGLTPTLGGGGKCVGLSNATTIPTSLLSGTGSGLVFYSHNGQLEIDGYGYGFNALCPSPNIYQTQQISTSNPNNLTITPQAPGASAASTATGTPGSVIVNYAVPVSTGTEAGFQVQRNGAFVGAIRTLASPNTGFGALYLASNIIPVIQSNAAQTQIGNNSVSVYTAPGGSIYVAVVSGSGIQLGFPATSTTFGGGINVIGITNATTNPTTNPTGGVTLYGELTTGHLKNRGSKGAVTTMAPAGSSGTINTQAQIIDVQIGTTRTVSSATVTTVLTLATASTTSGVVSVTCISRAITAPSAGAIGDTYAIVKEFTYRNVAGTLTIVGTNITGAAITDTSVTTTSFTITTDGGTNILVQVANVASATIDSQVVADITVC